jgi:two-component sensor histidine kinase
MHNIREKESLQNIVEILNTRNKELRLLYETSRFFSSTLDINELYDKLYDVLLNIVDFQDMYVARFDENSRKIKYIYLRSVLEPGRIDVSVIPEIPLAQEGKGILSEAIRRNDILVVNDYQKRLQSSSVKYHVTNKGALSDKEIEKTYVIDSALIVPIKLNRKILGFITIMSKNKNEFDDKNLHWIETVVNQASIANKNAILFKDSLAELGEIRKLEDELASAVHEKFLLKDEAAKRVKENMKLVSSLIRFQLDYIKDPLQKEFFRKLEARTHALSLMQEKVYELSELNGVDFEDYLRELIPGLYTSFDISLGRVSAYVNIRGVTLPIDKAITCALIINELVSNSLLHSFPNRKTGKIEIEMHEEDLPGRFILSVSDNGSGVIPGKGKMQSFSMVFIGMLVKNLGGTFGLDRSHGMKAVIRFRV